MIYLDNAATSFPKPIEVTNSITNAILKNGANPGRSGHKFSIKTAACIYECRKILADFFGASGPQCVIFTLNCTHAINMVLKGFLNPGDHVVISCLEHNSVIRPLKNLCDTRGIFYSKAEVFCGDGNKTVSSFSNKMNKKTKLIACLHASNVWGIKLPIEKLADLAHNFGAQILVDAAQTAGISEINIKKNKIDYLCISGHKGLYGPMGTGVLITECSENLNTILQGGTGINSASLEQPDDGPEKFEIGTINVPGILGLKSGLDFVNKIGIKKIAEYENNLMLYLYKNLKDNKAIKLYTEEPTMSSFIPIISFNVLDKKSEEISYFLDKHDICVRSGLHCSPMAHNSFKTACQGAVRISPSVFTTQKDVNRALELIEEFV
ncbi:MAG: aminotransferase class V-fold PLP-dependent enzyme [Oscillospiraceae bacterium]|nr:aminotransferase class V-fold PLP-dependent enzyme [Oscillospiraceae bacterium]